MGNLCPGPTPKPIPSKTSVPKPKIKPNVKPNPDSIGPSTVDPPQPEVINYIPN